MCNTPNLKINFPTSIIHNIETHQDIHSHLGSLNSITFWLPLQTTKFNMGPIEYIPGSHKKALPSKSGLLIDNFGHKDFVCDEIKIGECLIFSQLLVHRSRINLSNKARISLQIRFNDMSSVEWKKKFLHCGKEIQRAPSSWY